MSGKIKRKTVHLECSECKNRNYKYLRSSEGGRVRLEVNKFCKFCQKHTLHIEAR